MLSVFACSSARRLALALALALASSACAHGSTAGRGEPPVTVLEIVSETRDADVWVDGEYVGQVEAVSGALRLAPGVHRVEIRKPGYFPVQRTVRVVRKAGGTVSVSAEMLTDPR